MPLKKNHNEVLSDINCFLNCNDWAGDLKEILSRRNANEPDVIGKEVPFLYNFFKVNYIMSNILEI